eukprot:gene176-302_t
MFLQAFPLIRKIPSPISQSRRFARNYFEELFSPKIVNQEISETIPKINVDDDFISSNGLTDYIGRTAKDGENRWATDRMIFKPLKPLQLFKTRWNLWFQLPWKKIKGKTILKLKIQGSLQIEPSQSSGFSFGSVPDFEVIDSLADVTKLFTYAALDPRVVGILVDISSLNCGYGKLRELRRIMDYFRQSGKEIIGYCAAGAEKELYVGMGCNELYVPPDGSLDLRGFTSAATFVRGIFNNIGIEPQVQRIGKYKSFGDTFNRTSISDAQREVISSLLIESSDYWADDISMKIKSKSKIEIMKQLWDSDGVKSPYELKAMGYITGVNYMDQVENLFKIKLQINKTSFFPTWNNNNKTAIIEEPTGDFSLESELALFPRRKIENINNINEEQFLPFQIISNTQSTNNNSNNDNNEKLLQEFQEKQKILQNKEKEQNQLKNQLAKGQPSITAGGIYLRKMKKGSRILEGLPTKETFGGARVAIINADGGISSGKSGSSGISGKTIGSDTVIAQIRRIRNDPGIRAVVLRIDSPGGSALASDLMWREIRMLCREKPVIASMVDVAASGGYYMAMACDQIVAEDLTITGSIGVVASKFNAKELFDKLGYGVELLSRGKFAEVLTSARGFTEAEKDYFEKAARQAYDSFIGKAAASRGLSVPDMEAVAQGRVWTGRQALDRGLVDHIGGLATALQLAASMSNMPKTAQLRVQTITDSSRRLPFPLSLLSSNIMNSYNMNEDSSDNNNINNNGRNTPILALCDDVIASVEMASPESMGIGSAVQKLGLSPVLSYMLTHNGLTRQALQLLYKTEQETSILNTVQQIIKSILI